jgi:hypothetical protein
VSCPGIAVLNGGRMLQLQLMSCQERKQRAASSPHSPSSIAAPTLAPTIIRILVVLREVLLLLLLLPAGRPVGGGGAPPLALPRAALSAAALPPSTAVPPAAAPSAAPLPSSAGVVRVSSGAVTSSVEVAVVASVSESTSAGSGLPSQALMYAATSRLQGRPPWFRQRTLML